MATFETYIACFISGLVLIGRVTVIKNHLPVLRTRSARQQKSPLDDLDI